jgi:hypothetical protein
VPNLNGRSKGQSPLSGEREKVIRNARAIDEWPTHGGLGRLEAAQSHPILRIRTDLVIGVLGNDADATRSRRRERRLLIISTDVWESIGRYVVEAALSTIPLTTPLSPAADAFTNFL